MSSTVDAELQNLSTAAVKIRTDPQTVGLQQLPADAIQRAEDADPNKGRCLIEKRARHYAVEPARVFSRSDGICLYQQDTMMDTYQMVRGVINIDDEKNIIFLGASLHELYKNKKWALLPEKRVVMNYVDKFARNGPDTCDEKGGLYRYTFLPLQDMKDIYLVCQNGGMTVPYPFKGLPVIESHVHPRYAILHLGQVLSEIPSSAKDKILAWYPWLSLVVGIHVHRRSVQGDRERTDTLYECKVYEGPGSAEGFEDLLESYNARDRSPPRRLRRELPYAPPSPPRYEFYTSDSEDMESDHDYDVRAPTPPGRIKQIVIKTRRIGGSSRAGPSSEEDVHAMMNRGRSLARDGLTTEAVESLQAKESNEENGDRVMGWVMNRQ